MRNRASRRQSGYSLSELIVVVAIIGVLALVTVPNFTAMYRANQLRGSLRQFASDVRGARQRAATTSSLVRITFDETSRPGRYAVLQSTDRGTTWRQVTQRDLERGVYFKNGSFTDAYGADSKPDIVFRSDGTAVVTEGAGTMELRLDSNTQKTSYAVEVGATGRVSTK